MLSFLPFFQKDKLWKRNLNFLDMWHPGFQVCLGFVHSQGPRSSDKMIPPLSYCLPLSAHKASLQIGLYHPCQPCEGSCNLQMVTEKEIPYKRWGEMSVGPPKQAPLWQRDSFPIFQTFNSEPSCKCRGGNKRSLLSCQQTHSIPEI